MFGEWVMKRFNWVNQIAIVSIQRFVHSNTHWTLCAHRMRHSLWAMSSSTLSVNNSFVYELWRCSCCRTSVVAAPNWKFQFRLFEFDAPWVRYLDRSDSFSIVRGSSKETLYYYSWSEPHHSPSSGKSFQWNAQSAINLKPIATNWAIHRFELSPRAKQATIDDAPLNSNKKNRNRWIFTIQTLWRRNKNQRDENGISHPHTCAHQTNQR